jgi:hypothetical protein
MTFSPLLKGLFDQPYDLNIFASWDLEVEGFPAYILLRIQPKLKDFGYDIILDLRTLDVIELSVVLHDSGSSSRTLPIALNDLWKKDIRESIHTLR